jgi:hypothetical protein
VIAMRIVTPADEKRSGADFRHAIDDAANRALRLSAFTRNEAVRKAEEENILRSKPKLRARSPCLLLAESP